MAWDFAERNRAENEGAEHLLVATIVEKGFSEAKARSNADRQEVVLTGKLADAPIGGFICFQGRWESHPVHRRVFRVSGFWHPLELRKRGVIEYLSSEVSKIGPVLASRIVERFGDQSLRVIAEDPKSLEGVEGFGKERINAIKQKGATIKKDLDKVEQSCFINGFLGSDCPIVGQIQEWLGDEAVDVLREDPYSIMDKAPEFDFSEVDWIAREIVRIPAEDLRRVQGAILFSLRRSMEEGHVFLYKNELHKALEKLEIPTSLVHQGLECLVKRKQAVVEESDVYLLGLYQAEVGLAKGVRQRIKPTQGPHGTSLKEVVGRVASESTIPLTPVQEKAVLLSLEQGAMVLTGGPGTGKTTTLRAIVEAHKMLKRRVALAAPTGRAADRMSKATEMEAKTVHRLLEWSPTQLCFRRNADCPLDFDTVIVDEASMVDIQLGYALEQALPEEATMIWVGDADQLPPIGPGHVFRQLIDSQHVPVVLLDRVFRQKEGSDLARVAQAISKGDFSAIQSLGREGDGSFGFMEMKEPDQIINALPSVVKSVASCYGVDPAKDVQVLSPMRKGRLGTEELNALLQAEIGPSRSTKKRGRFCVGDKVMQTVNDYEREVWNGDIGWVSEVGDEGAVVDFEKKRVSYRHNELKVLTLAYEITVHKRQGSVFPCVI
ncbi:MAG: AAA family ATPase, partial [Sandaracinaceae bacterium]|nr:AAA family ATPase [Sandaracinaceae bacterium]